MNIPLTQRQLLAALQHACECLKCWEPKRAGGTRGPGVPRRPVAWREGRALAWCSPWPGCGWAGAGTFHCHGGLGVCAALPVSRTPVCPFQQEFTRFSLKLFRRSYIYELPGELGNGRDAGDTPELL